MIDLEDAVAPSHKPAARSAIVEALNGPLKDHKVVVRINALDSPWADDDIAALLGTDVHALMLPKAVAPLPSDRLGGLQFIAMCETARGILTAFEVAQQEACVGLAWGGAGPRCRLNGSAVEPTDDGDT